MAVQPMRFHYEAQTNIGQQLSGTLCAPDAEQARQMLTGLQLRILELTPEKPPARPGALSGESFLAFNQQLAYLTQAGLPAERGLRLIAQDLQRGRMAATLRAVAGELDAGRTLPEALDRQKNRFPPLYGRLVEAGIQAGNLPALLLNLGRHLEMVSQMRAAIWRASAYPLMVAVGLMLVLLFISYTVLPMFSDIFVAPNGAAAMLADFKGFDDVRLPAVTRVLLWAGQVGPPIILAALALLGLVAFAWPLLRAARADQWLVERFLFPLPVLGKALRKNLIARWCDALRIAIEAGIDLPRAVRLAGASISSLRLERETRDIVAHLEAGRSLENIRPGRLLPATVTAAIRLGSDNGDLPRVLGTLSELYQQQARQQAQMLPNIITPLLMLILAGSMGLVITGLFMPLVQLIQMLQSLF